MQRGLMDFRFTRAISQRIGERFMLLAGGPSANQLGQAQTEIGQSLDEQ
jgi:hypothetical protein